MVEDILRNKKGFIAALDQSGGSSAKTLALYGVDATMYQNEDEMYECIHAMRSRVITRDVFNSDRILGVILFKHTMKNTINGINTVEYLNNKGISSFLKIDIGLDDKKDGVQLLKDIPDLESILLEAKNYGVIGTKMRSVISEYNEYGIKKVIKQQFEVAKIIMNYGLIPIIEPEVSIDATSKRQIEHFMKKVIKEELNKLKEEDKLIFKFTLPSERNFYDELLNNKKVLRIVALSGGYTRVDACELLKANKNMVASFSRALLEGLNVNQSDEEFISILDNTIDVIYDASVNKM